MRFLFDWLGGFTYMLIEALTGIASWVDKYQFFVATIGIPISLWMMTQFLQKAAEEKGNKDRQQLRETAHQGQKLERDLRRKMQLAEFRQRWVNELRSDFARYASLHAKVILGAGKEIVVELTEVGSRILMRMNVDDPDYKAIEARVIHAFDYASTDKAELESLRKKYEDSETITTVGQRVLKREWDRLKRDLEDVIT